MCEMIDDDESRGNNVGVILMLHQFVYTEGRTNSDFISVHLSYGRS